MDIQNLSLLIKDHNYVDECKHQRRSVSNSYGTNDSDGNTKISDDNNFYNNNDFVILDDIKNLNNKTLKNYYESNHTFLFDTCNYIEDILNSYSYDVDKILEQASVDYCRTKINLNKTRINTINEFIRKNDRFNNLVLSSNVKDFNFLTILIMLCCQSSYGLHYMSLKDIYCDNTEKPSLLLCSSSENRNTSFVVNDNILSIVIETNLVIKDTNNNAIIKKINTKVIIDSNLEPVNGCYVKFNDYGIFYWSTSD